MTETAKMSKWYTIENNIEETIGEVLEKHKKNKSNCRNRRISSCYFLFCGREIPFRGKTIIKTL
jgi:hypothetical protein